MVKLFTRLDNEAIDVAKARPEMPAAVARLVQLVPPAQLDLVDEVLVRVGRRDLNLTLNGRRSTWFTSSRTEVADVDQLAALGVPLAELVDDSEAG